MGFAFCLAPWKLRNRCNVQLVFYTPLDVYRIMVILPAHFAPHMALDASYYVILGGLTHKITISSSKNSGFWYSTSPCQTCINPAIDCILALMYGLFESFPMCSTPRKLRDCNYINPVFLIPLDVH